MKINQQGFSLAELIVVISMSGLFAGLMLFFMVSYWRYGLLQEADLDTLTSRLNAGDYVREALNPASGLVIQNSVQDNNPSVPDNSISPIKYWAPIHAIPGTVSIGASGTKTSLIYFKRPSVNTSGVVVMNGSQPYEDEYIFYLDGTTKKLMSRTLANPSAASNKLKTSCPAALASSSCPADRIIASDISSVETRYFSKTGNTIDYTSSYDAVTHTYTGPDFPVVEVVELKLNLSKKPIFQTSNATINSTVIRVAIRS